MPGRSANHSLPHTLLQNHYCSNIWQGLTFCGIELHNFKALLVDFCNTGHQDSRTLLIYTVRIAENESSTNLYCLPAALICTPR
jgi:hypothetical protein